MACITQFFAIYLMGKSMFSIQLSFHFRLYHVFFLGRKNSVDRGADMELKHWLVTRWAVDLRCKTNGESDNQLYPE
jgi:hypothetical protein